jgi:hypothetical protein
MNVPIMAHVSAVSSLLPAIAGLVRYKKLNKAMRVFTIFSIVGVIHILVEFILGRLDIRNSRYASSGFLEN